jgi:hypothetical protein
LQVIVDKHQARTVGDGVYANQQAIDMFADLPNNSMDEFDTPTQTPGMGMQSPGVYGNQPAIHAFMGLPGNTVDDSRDDVDDLLGEIDTRVRKAIPRREGEDDEFGFGDSALARAQGVGRSSGSTGSREPASSAFAASSPNGVQRMESTYEANISFDRTPSSERQPIVTDTTYSQVDAVGTQALQKTMTNHRRTQGSNGLW